MDRHKLSWILEFILRQPVEDRIVAEIVRRLPAPPILYPHLKKTLFLRCLASDLSTGRLSDHTLQYVELLEELDRSLGAPEPHEALKAAYCSVAAELTAAPLRRAGSPAEAESEFLEAANRIWNCRVADLERSDAKGLVGEGLREWRREVEDATSRGDAARGRLLLRDTRGEAEAALMEYLNVALEDMGPPLLELLAAAVGRVLGTNLSAGSRVAAEPSRMSAELSVSTRAALADSDSLRSTTDTRWILPAQEKERLKVPKLGGQMHFSGKDIMLVPHFLSTVEGNQVNKALETNSMDLPNAVENLLPEKIVRVPEIPNRMAEAPANPSDSEHNQDQVDIQVSRCSIKKDTQVTTTERIGAEDRQGEEECVEMLRNRMIDANPNDSGHNQNQADMDIVRPSVGKGAQATSTKEIVVEDQQARERAEMPWISLMERNPTARTCQWDEDSDESLSEKSTDHSKRPHLPTPKMEKVSPLKLYKDAKFVRRRNKKWTSQEEDALREAVKKHGKGNWKFILECYPGTFADRTEVNLKDKWRNMTSQLSLQTHQGCKSSSLSLQRH